MTLVLAARRQIGYALGRAAGGISWLLRDDFTTDLPAGSVNGTAAEPGPGTRTVVDIAGNKVSLSGGKAIIQPNYAWNNEILRYSNVSSTVAGKLLITKVMVNNALEARLSFGNAGNWSHGFLWDGLRAWSPETKMGGQPVNGAWQEYALVTRATGMFFFINAGYWRLLWMRTHTAPETQTVDLEAVSVKLEVDYVRVPDILWLPTPLASDGFGSAFGTTDGLGHAEGVAGGIGAGGGGVTWSNGGGTWSVSGGKAINTPTLGAELAVNGSMETGDPPTSWTANDATLDGIADERPGGSGIQSLQVTATNVSPRAEQAITLEANQYYKISGWCKRTGGSVIRFSLARASDNIVEVSLDASNTSWSAVSATGYVTVANCKAFCSVLTIGGVGTFDDFSIRKLELTELLTLSDVSCADVFASVSMVLSTANTYEGAGLALSWDSAISPSNGMIVVRNGPYLMVYKCVAGVWSRVSFTAYTYSAGAQLVVAKNGTGYRVYYNNAFIVAATISDAGIVNNTLHGMFSTDASNTLDDFTCYATGTGGEYATLDQYIQP